jgi:aspartate kinase
MNAEGDLTTLGRGGSDTSAVALAAALQSAFCEINTDVEGVFTADPRYVKTSRLIHELDYETTLELAALGGKVLHSRCVEVAAKYQVPLVVRSTFHPDESRRTKIMRFEKEQALEAPVVSGITLDEDVAKITLQNVPSQSNMLARVFSAVAERGINVDIIVHDRSEGHINRVGFTVQGLDLEATVAAVQSLRNLHTLETLEIETQTGLAKVSAVGLGMRSHSGVALKVFGTLSENGIEILMVSTSEIKISCVVPLEQGKRAAQLLHGAFFDSL